MPKLGIANVRAGQMEATRKQASPEAELSFRSVQLRATVSLRNWRACAVAPGAAGFVGLEEEGAHQGGRPVFCLCSLGWELSVLAIIPELGGYF